MTPKDPAVLLRQLVYTGLLSFFLGAAPAFGADFSTILKTNQSYLFWGGVVIVLLIFLSLYRKYRQHETGTVEYNDSLRAALTQTQLTPKDHDKLRGIQTFYHLSDREVKQFHLAQFHEVFANTPPETFVVGLGLSKLEVLRKALELSEKDVADIDEEIVRIKRRSEISKGVLTEVVSPISLLEGETCHFVSDARLLEGDLPESEGIRFGFGRRAVYFRDGELLPMPSHGLSPGDKGKLVLTSRRIVFRGRERVQMEYGKLGGVVVFHDAVGFYPDAPQHWFLLPDPETAAVIATKAAQEHVTV